MPLTMVFVFLNDLSVLLSFIVELLLSLQWCTQWHSKRVADIAFVIHASSFLFNKMTDQLEKEGERLSISIKQKGAYWREKWLSNGIVEHTSLASATTKQAWIYHAHTHTYTHHHHHHHFPHRFSTIFLTSSTVRSRSIIVSSLYLSHCIGMRRRRVLHLDKGEEKEAKCIGQISFVRWFVSRGMLMIEICPSWNNQQVALFQTNLHILVIFVLYTSQQNDCYLSDWVHTHWNDGRIKSEWSSVEI